MDHYLTSDRIHSSEELNIRQAFEGIYKQKLKEIQGFYSEQNKSLKKTLEEAYKKVLADELLMTLIGDKTTSKFIEQRVEQCFQQIVFSEREIIIQNQSIQITELKFKLQEMSRRCDKMKDDYEAKNSITHRQKIASENKNAQICEQLKRKTEQLQKSRLRISCIEKQLSQKNQSFKQVLQENQDLKKTLQHIDSELKNTIDANIQKYQNQNNELTKYRQCVGKLQKKLRQTEQCLQQTQAQLKKQSSDYKSKIDQYKQKMTQLITSSQLKESNLIQNNNSSVTLTPSELQNRLNQTVNLNKKRLQQLKEQNEKQKNQLQRKYQTKHRQTQQYYQKVLLKKVSEVQSQASEFWENIKRQEATLRQLIKNYEDNYISSQEHTLVLKQREDLIYKMKQKLEEYEQTIDENLQKISQFQKTLHQYENTLNQRNIQIQKLQNSLSEQFSLTKKYEQVITELKTQLKKSQSRISNLQQDIQRQTTRIEGQKSANTKSSQDINFLQKQIRQKQLKVKELNDQLQERQRKCKKLENQLMIVNNNYNEIQQLFKENKRVLSELEFKIKHSEHDNQLTANEYNHKVKKLTEEGQAKNQEIKNLTSHFKSIQQEYLALKSTHTELQTINKKLELQVKYLKETQTAIKGDYSAQVSDLKNRINEKNLDIQNLKQEMQKETKILAQKVKEQHQMRKTTELRLKYSTKALSHAQKLIRTLTAQFSKQIDTIRACVKNTKTIYENQISLHKKTFAIQSIEIIRNIDHSTSQRMIQQSQKFEQQKKRMIERSLFQRQQVERSFNSQFQKQKQQFFQIIQQKDKDFNKLQAEYRGLQYEVQRKKQQISQQEKTIQSLENKLTRQQEQHKKKIKELADAFESDKNQLVEEFEEKRDITNGELQQLTKNIQKMRIEMENTKSNYEEEKLQINSQLRSIQEQQNVVKQVVYRKQEEIKRLDEQLKRLTEQKNYLQNSLRELSDLDQRKMMRIHELEFMQNQLNQSLNLVKVKLQRTEEENSLLKQAVKENEQNVNKEMKNRVKAQTQLKDIKAAIDRNDKFRDLRALQQMTVETQQLTSKVNQMKRMSQYLDRTPLRS